MSRVRQAWSRVLAAMRRRHLDDDFDAEVQSHIDLATDDLVARGMSLDESRRVARLRFGFVASAKDRHRDARGFAWLDGLLFDLRLAIRGLRRDRGFALTAVATLTIALALNVTVTTVRAAMVTRGMPLAHDSGRLAYLALRKPSDLPCCPGPVGHADFERWRADADAFDDLAFGPVRVPVAFRADGRLIDTTISRQTTNLFRLLGVQPILGRDFSDADGRPGAAPVVIVSHEFWVRWLGQRADVVGLAVQLDSVPATVIGVLPPRFAIVFPQDVYAPVPAGNIADSGVIGRLRTGVTLDDARAQIETITARLQANDGVPRGVPLVRTYAQSYIAPDAPRIYGALWTGAWFVVLIACANLSNLMLVRTAGRWREFATRAALGAGQVRLLRQMLLESVIVTAAAVVLAWGTAQWALQRWSEATASRYLFLDYSVTAGTLLYLLTISAAAAVVIVLLPLARLVRLGVNEALKSDARGATQGPRLRRLTSALVGGQMALAIVLLLGAGVLVRSFENIVGAETGVHRPEEVAAGLVGLPSDAYPTPASRIAFFERLASQLRVQRGDAHVAVASTIPVRGVRGRPIEIDGRRSSPDARELAQMMTVSPEYFETMGRPVLAGRGFTEADDVTAAAVVLVNESFAAQYWPDREPLGQRLRTFDAETPGPWRTVVGVVPDIMQGDPTRQTFRPVIYVPFRQQPAARAFLLVRADTPGPETLRATLAAIQRTDPNVITEEFSQLHHKFAFDRDWMDLEHADLGKHAAIAPVFAVVAVILSALGLVAVIAHSVTQRTKEIGVRLAIGAAARDIARMVVREGMRPVAIGLFTGLGLAAATNRVLESQLVAVSPYDPLTLVGGPLILIAVALAGCRIPARRAMKVDPVVALRHE